MFSLKHIGFKSMMPNY